MIKVAVMLAYTISMEVWMSDIIAKYTHVCLSSVWLWYSFSNVKTVRMIWLGMADGRLKALMTAGREVDANSRRPQNLQKSASIFDPCSFLHLFCSSSAETGSRKLRYRPTSVPYLRATGRPMHVGSRQRGHLLPIYGLQCMSSHRLLALLVVCYS